VLHSSNQCNLGIGEMIGSLLWNHWFWITILAVTKCSCDSLQIQPYDLPVPLLQSFATSDLVRGEGQGETDDGEEPFIASDGGRNVMVSKSVSVSRVSVEIGGVRVGKKISEAEDKLDKNITKHDSSENVPINDNSVKPQSFFQNLISQLKSIASVTAGEDTKDPTAIINEDNRYLESEENSSQLAGAEEYQLVYRDEDFANGDPDHDIHDVSNDYHSFPHNNYGDYLGDAFSDISEEIQGEHPEVHNDLIDYNDYIELNDDKQLEPIKDDQASRSLGNLVIDSQESDLVRSRSDQARGRSLILQEDDIKYFSKERSEVVEDDLNSQQISEVKDTNKIQNNNDQVKNSEMDFVIDFSSPKANLDINIKIGIFVGVAMGVILIAVVAVLILRRNVRHAKLVIDEDQSTTDSQFVFSRGVKSNTSGREEQHFNSNFGKSSYTRTDDLYSLDNDSFLTSLETCSVKERFTWD